MSALTTDRADITADSTAYTTDATLNGVAAGVGGGMLTLPARLPLVLSPEAAAPSTPGEITYLGASAPYAAASLSSSHSFSVTAPAGVAHPCIIVEIGRRTADSGLTSVTVAGVAMTQVGVAERANRGAVSVWVLAGDSCPNDGGTKTVQISCTGTIQLGAVALNFAGVDETTPVPGVAASDLNGATITTAIAGVEAGEWLLDAVTNYFATTPYTPGSGQVEVVEFGWLRGAGNFTVAASYKSDPAPGSASMTQTPSSSTDLAHLVIRLKPAAGGGTPPAEEITARLAVTPTLRAAVQVAKPLAATGRTGVGMRADLHVGKPLSARLAVGVRMRAEFAEGAAERLSARLAVSPGMRADLHVGKELHARATVAPRVRANLSVPKLLAARAAVGVRTTATLRVEKRLEARGVVYVSMRAGLAVGGANWLTLETLELVPALTLTTLNLAPELTLDALTLHPET